jgi:hypothetical protein
MADEEKEKEKLLDLLAGIPEKAQRQEEIGKAIQESAQQAREIAGPFREIVLRVPAKSIPPEELAHQVSVLRSWHETADKLTGSQAVKAFIATTSAVTNTSTGMLYSLGPVEEPQIKAATVRLVQALNRTPLVKRAEAEMRRLRLHQRAGATRTPLELLGDAQQAFGGGPGSILIPLRESIEGSLAALLKQRPTQEQAGKPGEKIESLGRQCGRDELPLAHFVDLAASAKRILDTLSGAKQANLSREQVSEVFYQGVTFLNTLLESLDETKLRPQ